MTLWLYIPYLSVPIIWLWSITIGRYLSNKYGVDPTDVRIAWVILEGYLVVIGMKTVEWLQPLIIFVRNVKKTFRTSGLAGRIEEIDIRECGYWVTDLCVLLRDGSIFLPILMVWTLANEVRRMVPPVLNIIMFILSIYHWVLWLNFMVYDNYTPYSTPKSDIIIRQQPLAWGELDTISLHFQRAGLMNRQRFRYSYDGEVIKLQSWYFN
ncbi:hypothetical protein M434DRAFT_270454 [Hypoxylon sp. CO27-5]|nr:hypothetical protein M434DRAFT_270454 [Hypoxylon sp. CO27-5]